MFKLVVQRGEKRKWKRKNESEFSSVLQQDFFRLWQWNGYMDKRNFPFLFSPRCTTSLTYQHACKWQFKSFRPTAWEIWEGDARFGCFRRREIRFHRRWKIQSGIGDEKLQLRVSRWLPRHGVHLQQLVSLHRGQKRVVVEIRRFVVVRIRI